MLCHVTQPRLLQLAWAGTAYVLLGIDDTCTGMEVHVPVSSCHGTRLDIPSLLAVAEEELQHLLQRLLRPKEGQEGLSRRALQRYCRSSANPPTDLPTDRRTKVTASLVLSLLLKPTCSCAGEAGHILVGFGLEGDIRRMAET